MIARCTIVLLLLLFSLSQSVAQIWEGDYVIQSQEEVDEFVSSCNCTIIEGDLIITSSYLIQLDSLSILKEVKGSVVISLNMNLNNCNGLNNLTSIGQDLLIQSNPNLSNIDWFNNLNSIGGQLEISDNYTLLSAKGFENLQYIGETLSIRYNSSLVDLADFRSLQFCPVIDLSEHYNLNLIKGFNQLKSTGKILIQYNESLSDIIGFRNLNLIAVSMDIQQNPYLQNIAGFDKLGPIVETNLAIHSNDNLVSLTAFSDVIQLSGTCHLEFPKESNNGQFFENLETVSGILQTNFPNFQKLDSVATLKFSTTNLFQDTLSGFQNLKRVGTIEISNSSTLKHIDAFNQFEQIGSIEIKGNKQLKSITGFKQLKRLTGSLSILDNPNLSSITAFHLLKEINGDCKLSLPSLMIQESHFSNLQIIKGALTTNYPNFNQLDNVGGLKIKYDIINKDTLSGFTSLKKAGTLSILSNDSLKSITAFPNLESLHTLHFEYNNKLADITGFNNLTSIKGDFIFRYNPVMKDLNSFNQLKEIKNDIDIRLNNNLASISGFKKIEHVHTLNISSNNALLNIEGFNKLIEARKIYFSGNLKLEILPQFFNLKKLSSLGITSNLSLKEIPDFNHIADIQAISIKGNTNLFEVDGFENLNQCYSINISLNNSLLRIDGFTQLGNVSNYIAIQNRDLRVLDAFAGLVNVGRLDLSENIQLRSMNNFSNLLNITNSLVMKDNLQLNKCCLINCWLEQGVLDNATKTIHNNGNNCSDLTIIKTECETTGCTNNRSVISNIHLSTNPVHESLQFAFILNEDQFINYKIYTINDQLVSKGSVNGMRGSNNKTINLPGSQKGHYFLVLHNERLKEVVKFIKL